MFKRYKIHPNVIFLSTVSLLNDISSEMINPLLPLLIQQLGGAGLAIGIVGGLKESIANITKFLGGYLSDRLQKRTPFIILGYGYSSLLRLLLVLTHQWKQVFFLVGLEEFGKGIRKAPRDVLIAQSIPDKTGLGFGIHRAGDAAGSIIGSLLVVILLWFYRFSLQQIVFIAALISFVVLIPLSFVRDIPDHHLKKMGNLTSLSRELKLLIAILSINSLSTFSYMFYILHANDLVASYKMVGPLVLYVFYNVSCTFCAIPVGILSDKIGRWILVFIGCLLHGIMKIGFAYTASFWGLAFWFVINGITIALLEVVPKAYITDLSSDQQKGTALGIFFTVSGIASLIGSIVAGVAWDTVSHSLIFISSSFFSFITVLLLFFWKKKKYFL